MARPLSFDRSNILGQIKRTFWRYGYEATSLSTLVRATGLHKGSLYANFGDKTQMYCAALQLYDAEDVEAGIQLLGHAPGASPIDAIGRLLEAPALAIRDHSDRSGCFLCSALAERADLPQQARNIVDASRARLLQAIERALRAGRVPRSEAKAQELLAVYIGLRVMARGETTHETLFAIRDSAMRSLAAHAV